MERIIRGALDDTVSETAGSVLVEGWIFLDGEETINGDSYQHKALRKSGYCSSSSEADGHVLFGHMMQCQRLRGMKGGDIVVLKDEYW